MLRSRAKLTVAQRALLVATAVLLAVEIYCVATGQQLLSQAVWHASASTPLVPFGAGFLCGHLFWQATTVYTRWRKTGADGQPRDSEV